MLLGTHSHLHGCRNLCILQHCWLQGCDRWQRPRLLLMLVKSSALRKPHAVGYAFSPARLPQSVHPTALLAWRVQQMAATAPSAYSREVIRAWEATCCWVPILTCTVAAICASYNHVGLKGATDGSDRASCSYS